MGPARTWASTGSDREAHRSFEQRMGAGSGWMYVGVALTELAMEAQIQSRPPFRRFKMSFSGSSS